MLFAKKDRDKNSGFAITLTLGVGLVLTVVGISVVLKGVASKNDAESQDRKNVAAAQADQIMPITSFLSLPVQD